MIPAQLITARELLRQGFSLRDAAAVVGLRPGQLDRMLWDYIGVKASEKAA